MRPSVGRTGAQRGCRLSLGPDEQLVASAEKKIKERVSSVYVPRPLDLTKAAEISQRADVGRLVEPHGTKGLPRSP